MGTSWYTHTHISLLCQLRDPGSNDTPVTVSTLEFRSWFLIPFYNKRYQLTLHKWLNLRLRQEEYKIYLEYHLVPESKEVLKNKTESC